jgi:hypothetical protein
MIQVIWLPQANDEQRIAMGFGFNGLDLWTRRRATQLIAGSVDDDL